MTAAARPPARVVVVDDSQLMRRMIRAGLEADGTIEVVGEAGDCAEARQLIRSLSPDVITLDLEMPLLDGFAFLRWLMANNPVPVIVVSSRASDRSVFKALEFGAVDFIAKLFSAETVSWG